MVDPLRVVPETMATISVVLSVSEVLVKGAVKVVEKNPPRVFPPKVVLVVPLKVPPLEDVKIKEASVRFPEESVIITVRVVVAPENNGVISRYHGHVGRRAAGTPGSG